MKKHPFSSIQNASQGFADQADAKFEEDCVKQLLAAYDIAKLKWDLLRRNQEELGVKVLTLAGFCTQFGSFPLLLQSRASRFASSDKLHYLMQNFEEREVVQLFLETRLELPEEWRLSRPFGLILKWPYMPKGLVIHELGDTGTPGCRITYRRGHAQIAAEPFPQLIQYLKTAWSPTP